MSLEKVLTAMVDSGKVPHAILLHENDGGGAFPLALHFLEHLYGQAGGILLRPLPCQFRSLFWANSALWPL